MLKQVLARGVDLASRYRSVAGATGIGAIGLVLWLSSAPIAVQWLFSAFALVVAAVKAVSMIRALRQGRLGIDVLAVMALVATVAVGEYVASLIIVFMLAGGEALEDFATARARRNLDSLLKRAPQIAHRLGAGSATVEDIPATDVRVGDVLLVRPSEVVPVDGVLLSDEASFDESSLTGEGLPVDRKAGEPILSGSVNGRAAAQMRASSTAAGSQYQSIIALVEEASALSAPVVRLADRYAVPFTAVSLLIAGLAWLISGDPVRFAEVLVLATPCPLIIAAPVAFVGGMSRAARAGIIVKGGGVLELLARARTVVFDKTGTLTHGSLVITKVLPEAPFGEGELLVLAASAEQYSSHVLAQSVVEVATERGLKLIAVENASEVATHGVTALVGGREVAVGKLRFIQNLAPNAHDAALDGGELAIYVAVDHRFAGTIIARDRVRGNAKAAVAELRMLGAKQVVMLTGDARATAEFVARQVGIDTVRAECLPVDKVNAVQAFTDRPVIMVGDGVNDAPVLAAADVGIAMGARGATAASESADVVIMLDDVSRTVTAIKIGKRTVQVALQSIGLGIALSIVLMLVASFGVIPATVGAFVQEAVDLATILIALRAELFAAPST